jgi:hypothetical protein
VADALETAKLQAERTYNAAADTFDAEPLGRAERLLGRNGIAEVLALLGYYSSVSMGMKLHRVPVPAPARG